MLPPRTALHSQTTHPLGRIFYKRLRGLPAIHVPAFDITRRPADTNEHFMECDLTVEIPCVRISAGTRGDRVLWGGLNPFAHDALYQHPADPTIV